MNCKQFASAERSPEAAAQIGKFSVSRLRCPGSRTISRSKQLPRCGKNTRSPPTESDGGPRMCYAAVVAVCWQVEPMNWRRGLFRLWIVGTALFVIAVAFVSYNTIKTEFEAVARKPYAPSSTPAPNSNTKIIEFEGQLHN